MAASGESDYSLETNGRARLRCGISLRVSIPAYYNEPTSIFTMNLTFEGGEG